MEIVFSYTTGDLTRSTGQCPAPLFCIAINADLYHKAVQVCYIPIHGDIKKKTKKKTTTKKQQQQQKKQQQQQTNCI